MVQLFNAEETGAVLAITDVTDTASTNTDPEKMLGTRRTYCCIRSG
ncbi:hypothetical protein Ait01nite_081920 [Actinoplanes italicus]|uniref:Uncharacterized protein n=1 Tax=Actinoplanes italicus TaxID=113567 RepID=A0A2T0K363_9ACTN|nr:hypothetical protein [Actinoplanes italicus]PRX17296.1 hypothetical protein CLV67_11672 [Actinoplanes italicus]GIE35147.1 hypothetical protein Ait01nite_081920 [Actinoplanes italicus]